VSRHCALSMRRDCRATGRERTSRCFGQVSDRVRGGEKSPPVRRQSVPPSRRLAQGSDRGCRWIDGEKSHPVGTKSPHRAAPPRSHFDEPSRCFGKISDGVRGGEKSPPVRRQLVGVQSPRRFGQVSDRLWGGEKSPPVRRQLDSEKLPPVRKQRRRSVRRQGDRRDGEKLPPVRRQAVRGQCDRLDGEKLPPVRRRWAEHGGGV